MSSGNFMRVSYKSCITDTYSLIYRVLCLGVGTLLGVGVLYTCMSKTQNSDVVQEIDSVNPASWSEGTRLSESLEEYARDYGWIVTGADGVAYYFRLYTPNFSAGCPAYNSHTHQVDLMDVEGNVIKSETRSSIGWASKLADKWADEL